VIGVLPTPISMTKGSDVKVTSDFLHFHTTKNPTSRSIFDYMTSLLESRGSFCWFRLLSESWNFYFFGCVYRSSDREIWSWNRAEGAVESGEEKKIMRSVRGRSAGTTVENARELEPTLIFLRVQSRK